MRRWWPALLTVLAAVGMFTYLRWYDRPDTAETARAPELIKLLDLDRDAVTALAVAGQGYVLHLVRAGGQWAVADPGSGDDGELDGEKVSRLLFSLDPLYAGRKVADQAGDPAAWGLDRPAWVVSVQTGPDREEVLRIGAHQPVNSSYYVQVGSDPAVYTISAGLPASIPETRSGWFRHPG